MPGDMLPTKTLVVLTSLTKAGLAEGEADDPLPPGPAMWGGGGSPLGSDGRPSPGRGGGYIPGPPGGGRNPGGGVPVTAFGDGAKLGGKGGGTKFGRKGGIWPGGCMFGGKGGMPPGGTKGAAGGVSPLTLI